MPEFLQNQFDAFHEKIKLDNIEDYQTLREKREMLIQEIKDWLGKNKKPFFDAFNQGSYTMKTGIVPMEGEDYDLDVDLEFRLSIQDYYDPTEVKQWVFDALNAKNNRTVEIKTSCVRVQYFKEGEPRFHIDFAVYGRADAKKASENLHLAKGSSNSGKEFKKWELAEPFALKNEVSIHFSGEELAQMRRCIRYMKRWKDNKFDDNDGRPTGIAMTSMALDWFKPFVKDVFSGKEKISDLNAMKKWAETIHVNNFGLDTRLPVKPFNDLFAKIKKSERNTENYKNRLAKLCDALRDAAGEVDPHDAAEILEKHFGDDFPVPKKQENARVSSRPAVAPAIGSA